MLSNEFDVVLEAQTFVKKQNFCNHFNLVFLIFSSNLCFFGEVLYCFLALPLKLYRELSFGKILKVIAKSVETI